VLIDVHLINIDLEVIVFPVIQHVKVVKDQRIVNVNNVIDNIIIMMVFVLALAPLDYIMILQIDLAKHVIQNVLLVMDKGKNNVFNVDLI